MGGAPNSIYRAFTPCSQVFNIRIPCQVYIESLAQKSDFVLTVQPNTVYGYHRVRKLFSFWTRMDTIVFDTEKEESMLLPFSTNVSIATCILRLIIAVALAKKEQRKIVSTQALPN